MISPRVSSMLYITRNHKVKVVSMTLHSFLVTRRFALVVAGMDTQWTHVIGSMDFLLILVRIMTCKPLFA